MAYEILSIKMYELDKKISRLQSRIQTVSYTHLTLPTNSLV